MSDQEAMAGVLEDLAPTVEDTDRINGGALATLVILSPLTLGLGQIANLNLGNGPILGGHANIGT